MRPIKVFFVYLFASVYLLHIHAEVSILARAVLKVLRKSFVPNTKEIYFYIKCDEEPYRINYFHDLADEILSEMDDLPVIFGSQLELPDNVKINYAILIIDSNKAIQFLCRKLLTNFQTIGNQVLVILKTFHVHYYDMLGKALYDLSSNGVLLAQAIVEVLPGRVLMFHTRPFTTQWCDEAMSEVVNHFISSNSTWRHDDFFLDGISNLEGCPWVFAVLQMEPYFNIVQDGRGKQIMTGICGKFIEYLTNRLNFTPKFYFMTQEEYRLMQGGNKDVVNKLFLEKGIDFITGPIFFRPVESESLFKVTNAYYTRTLALITSTRHHHLSSIETIFMPFVFHVWIFTLVYFGIGVVVIWILKHIKRSHREFVIGERNPYPIYTMFTTAFGGGHNIVPRNNFARFLFCIWMMLWLVLRTAYQSAFYYFLSHNVTRPQPESIDEAISQGYIILMSTSTYVTFNRMPHIQAAVEIFDEADEEAFAELLRRPNKVALLKPIDHLEMYLKNHLGQLHDFHVGRSTVRTHHMGMYYKRNLFNRFPIATAITEYESSGLSQKVRRDLLNLNTKSTKLSSTTYRPIEFHHLLGAFQLFMFGILLSSFVFLMEILIHTRCRRGIGRS